MYVTVTKRFIRRGVVFLFKIYVLVSLCGYALASNDGECKDQTLNLSDEERDLTCSLTTSLDENVRVSNLTSVSVDSVVRLTVICNNTHYFLSVLKSTSLSGFQRVRELNIEFCKIKELNENSLITLKDLRDLTIRTHNFVRPEFKLSLHSDVFKSLYQIERIDLSLNNIWQLPAGVFCHLDNLKFLNLSHNHLHSFILQGFGQDATSSSNPGILESCMSNIIYLELSNNDVTELNPSSLQGLTYLQNLSLKNNKLGKIHEKAFFGLDNLQSLDISNNLLIALPEDAFLYTPKLMKFVARNNSLSVLGPNLFQSLDQLLEVDLSHNELTFEMSAPMNFQGLAQLKLLDLSHNKISQLNQQIFHDLNFLQVLMLSNNQLTTISASILGNCVNLQTLDLSYNQLSNLPDTAFLGLNALRFLTLGNNQISNIGSSSLANLASLEDLDLSGNQFTVIPQAVGNLQNLKTLDIGENRIESLESMPLKGLKFLYGLRLAANKLSGNISKNTFSEIPSLKILNLSGNEITYIENKAFENNLNLQGVRIDGNKLLTMINLFEYLPNLRLLNVSDNQIEIFDYALVPKSLEWLGLRNNKIGQLGNYFEIHSLNLLTIDASYNKLAYINKFEIPNSIQMLYLNDNNISAVAPYTFFEKVNLTRVDLYNNQFSKLDVSAFKLSELPPEKLRPEFYLGGNPFVCSCSMEWLLRIDEVGYERQYPKIMDLLHTYCQIPFIRFGASNKSFAELNPSQLLCHYERRCFALCHCCEFYACDCELTCPEGCSCYHNMDWGTEIIDCSMQGMQLIPDSISLGATELYLDGNDLRNLSSYPLRRRSLRFLYLNHSHVESVDNTTFKGLTNLLALHLQDNLLESLQGNEFQDIESLRELYLHNNKLSFIHQDTFAPLYWLEALTLHDNYLVNFAVWHFVDNPFLGRVSLSANRWSCHCQFMEPFSQWIDENKAIVPDEENIKCFAADSSSSIISSNETFCALENSVASRTSCSNCSSCVGIVYFLCLLFS